MSGQWIEQTGIILFTEQYMKCVAFYRDVIGLEILFSKDSLTCFQFGSGYLMVESGGVASQHEKTFAQNAVTLRLNVKDVMQCAELLRQRGAEVKVNEWDWGTTGLLLDPDGNRVELKNHHDGFFAPAP